VRNLQDTNGSVTRRTLLGGGTALAGTLAAACGAGGGTSGVTGESKPGAELPAANVQFWHWGTLGADNYMPTFQEVSDKFMATSPKIKVENQMPSDYWNKMVVALASDTPPDVFLINSTRARQWFNQGTTRDVTPYLNKDKNAANDLKSVTKVFTDYYTVNGKLVGIPWDYSTIATVFNVDHLKEAGLTLPSQMADKWDWNMALEYAQKLTKKGATPMRWGLLAEATGETGWYNFIAANGGAIFDQNGKAATASPAVVEATQWLVDTINKTQYSPNRAQLTELAASNQKIAAMQQGRLSITFNGDWNFKPLTDPAIPLNWDVSYIPRSPKTKKTASIGNLRALVVTPSSKVPEQSWALVSFALRKEIQELIPARLQEVPAREESALTIYADPAKAGPPQNRKALTDAIKAVTPLPAHDLAPAAEWDPVITKWRNDIWDGKVAVGEGLKQLQDELQKVVDQYRK
jgi:multiple sugar transport system substrate-binding protein